MPKLTEADKQAVVDALVKEYKFYQERGTKIAPVKAWPRAMDVLEAILMSQKRSADLNQIKIEITEPTIQKALQEQAQVQAKIKLVPPKTGIPAKPFVTAPIASKTKELQNQKINVTPVPENKNSSTAKGSTITAMTPMKTNKAQTNPSEIQVVKKRDSINTGNKAGPIQKSLLAMEKELQAKKEALLQKQQIAKASAASSAPGIKKN